MSAHPDRMQLEAFDNLDPAARQDCLQHARGCRACREILAAGDPSRLFALLAFDPVDAAALDGLSRRVASALDSPRPAGRLFAAAIAASLLLAGVFSTYLWNRQAAAPAATVEAAAARPPAPPVESMGTIQVLSPEAAEVLNLQIGDTVWVMIFDESMEL